MRFLVLASLLALPHAVAGEPSDLALGAAEALVRQLAVTYPLADDKFKVCITVGGQEISPSVKKRLSGIDLQIVSCESKGLITHIPIATPKLESDGTYLVSYGYFLGVGAGKHMFAFMSHDSDGWHVLRVVSGVNF